MLNGFKRKISVTWLDHWNKIKVGATWIYTRFDLWCHKAFVTCVSYHHFLLQVLFDQNGCIKRYTSVDDILRDFYTVRLDYYQRRKDYLEGMLSAESLKLDNQARFIMEKIEGTITIGKEGWIRCSGGGFSQGHSLSPWRFEWNLRSVIFKLIVGIDGWGISSENTPGWLSLDLTVTDDDEPISVQVMAWGHQATSHYLSQCWHRFLLPYH